VRHSLPQHKRSGRSGLAAAAVIVTLFLPAASLNNLELKPGARFVLPQLPEAASGAPTMELSTALFDTFLVLLEIALPVSRLGRG